MKMVGIVNENPATWSEDVLKSAISAFPDLAEMNGKVKMMNSDNDSNALFMINYPEIKLAVLVVINNRKIQPINIVANSNVEIDSC